MTMITPSGGLTNRVIGDGGPWRVLIVDDEETIRLALSKFLRTRGYNVQTAESGPAALELYPHALAPLTDLPVLEVLSGVHIIADLTLNLGEVVHDYLAK